MVNFQNNRKILYSKIPKDYKKLKNNVLSLEQFIAIWFKDENIFSEGKINLFKYLNDNVDKMFTKKDEVRVTLKNKRSFYMSAGMSAGYLIDSRNKQISAERGKQKYDGNFELNNLKYNSVNVGHLYFPPLPPGIAQ